MSGTVQMGYEVLDLDERLEHNFLILGGHDYCLG